jgi:hypothetical protein
MTRKYAQTLIALIILVGLWTGITYYNRRKSREAPKTEASKEEKLVSLDSAQIQSVTFRPKDGEAVTCQREGGKWEIVQPKKLAADQSAFSSLLSSLTSATIDQVVEQHPSSLKDFGLDPPAYSLEVTTNAKPPQLTLLFGDDTPTGGDLYAQVVGNPRVVTIPSYLRSSLEKKLFDLRDRRAMTLDADQIRQITADYKGKKWTLEKNPEGVWDLVLPPPVRADRFTAEGLISTLRGLNMQSIVANEKKNLAGYGLTSPELRVELTSPAGKQTLLLGKKDKEGNRYFAVNSALNEVFTVGSDFRTQFEKDAADLREKDLFSFSNFEVKHVEVDSPKGHQVFDQQKNQWNQTAPSSKKLDSAKMDTFLGALRDLRADSFPKGGNLAQYGLTKPAYRFKVRFGEKNQTETVEIGKVGDHLYARRTTDPLPCELPKNGLDDVEKALNAL